MLSSPARTSPPRPPPSRHRHLPDERPASLLRGSRRATRPVWRRAVSGTSARAGRDARRTPRSPYINRELSWLDYARVLYEARDHRNPLLDRVNFLTIFASMLDEFFQIRISGLRQQLHAGSTTMSPDGRTAGEQLAAARERVLQLVAEHSRSAPDVRRALAAEGIEIVEYAAIPSTTTLLRQRFIDEIYPGPHAARRRPGPPVPVHLHAQPVDRRRAARPGDRRAPLRPGQGPPDPAAARTEVEPHRFVLIDQIIEANLDLLFSGMEILEHHLFRVTRNADLAIEEDEADDLLLAIEEELRRRRFGEAVRLEVERSMPEATRRDPPARARARRGRRLRGPRDARPDRAPRLRRPRSARPQGGAVDAGHAAPPRPARRGRAGRRLRGDPRRRHPRPPPLRELRRVGRAVHRPGRRRPRGPDDQA